MTAIAHACFFAHATHPELLSQVEYYRDDIQILRDLGFVVFATTKFTEIPTGADLYYTWWWGSGFPTLLHSLPVRRPNIFTGAIHYGEAGSYFSVGPTAAKGRVMRALTKLSLRLASANLFISKHEYENVHRFEVRNPYLIPPAIDAAYYRPTARAPTGW